jgi:hypothetical protein
MEVMSIIEKSRQDNHDPTAVQCMAKIYKMGGMQMHTQRQEKTPSTVCATLQYLIFVLIEYQELHDISHQDTNGPLRTGHNDDGY